MYQLRTAISTPITKNRLTIKGVDEMDTAALTGSLKPQAQTPGGENGFMNEQDIFPAGNPFPVGMGFPSRSSVEKG